MINNKGLGFTDHQHLDVFNLINMGGRVYDPVVGQFLSPDPYVQAPDRTQGLNRYSYCMNSPLMYVDPDGEFWHIIIGAVVGGVINLGIKAYQGKINSFGDGLAAFGIGAVAGAVGAATGGATFAAAGGAAGGIGGFLAGAAGGTAGTAFSSPILAMGNTAYFGDPMMTPKQYLMGIGIGGLLGGSVNGIIALANGRSFWNGNLPKTTTPTPIASPTQSPQPASAENKPQPTTQRNPEHYNSNYQDPSEIKLPEKLYKYVYEHPDTWDNPNTILPNKDGVTFYTTDGSLNSLNAKIDLALPKLPTHRIEIITSDPNFNFQNIQIIRPANGNLFNSAGGGWEILYNAPYKSKSLLSVDNN